MAITGQKIADALSRLLPSESTSDDQRVEREFREDSKEFHISVSGSAGTAELGLFDSRDTVIVTEVKLDPQTAVASSTTAYHAVTILYDDGAGGSDTTVASFSTSATALTAAQNHTMTLSTTGGVEVAGSKRLIFKNVNTGSATATLLGVRVKFKSK